MNWIILTHSIDKNLNPYYICIDWYLRNWKPFQFLTEGVCAEEFGAILPWGTCG